jgi:hypothetical protein
MEHAITPEENGSLINAFHLSMADFQQEATEVNKAEEASCSLQLKNLLLTNLKLLKLNEITNVLLF